MKTIWTRLLAGTLLVLSAGGAGALVPVPEGSPIPHATVIDNLGNIIGPVIGLSGNRPVVLLRNGSDRIPLTLKEDSTFSIAVSVYYGSANCTGTVVGIESYTKNGRSKGFMEWQDRVYGIADENVLIRNSSTTADSISAASRFISVNPSGSQCIDFGGSQSESDLFPAEVVDDLDNLFVPPFTLQ